MADILVVKVNMFFNPKEMDSIRNYIFAQKETGVVILPPYCEAVVVPEDIEIRVEGLFKKESEPTMTYAEMVYDIVKSKSKGMDAVYEDYILHLVGMMGLNALKENRLLETCGVVGGRQLYVLCRKK